MLGAAADFVGERFRRRGALIPPGYSWSFILLVDGAMVLSLIGSALQRPRADLPAATAAALLALAPLLLFFVAGVKFLPGVTWASSYAAAIILLFATSTPVDGDLAPALLVVALGSFAALAPPVSGVLALGSALALLVLAWSTHRLDALPLYLGMAGTGWLMGILTRIQAGLVVKQQEMQADLAEHAAADERRRIAREVHDVIAHSLSITLLHVTGARHALQQDRDVDDAVDALTDAERLGRQAMADIRRTVGLLEDGPAGTAPEPGIADIGDLIEDYLQAGLRVVLHADGSSDHVSAAVGLALYRITQESLANIAKHAPDSKATVELAVSPPTARLVIVNEMPVAVAAVSRGGRGLAGMRQRVELLGGVIDAGPCAQGWSVRAEIPLTDPTPRPWRCPLA
ncbi:Sensor histidine kinase LiaS [Mycobacterium talmoniae]|uniref:histidine kinase n=1 Tax=Mycobacterium talmoniae TaxID=1858794 RepID=A0A2S8BFQ5_9MYCO|nr:histidine kinase [Mycobacterium eburneum]PQM45500.1 Sensor histidine kinase LiaS [Mycobacterium talmoniae]TDH51408.1 two-component sensor histidine kinase [Mycobacterium eburneum]